MVVNDSLDQKSDSVPRYCGGVGVCDAMLTVRACLAGASLGLRPMTDYRPSEPRPHEQLYGHLRTGDRAPGGCAISTV